MLFVVLPLADVLCACYGSVDAEATGHTVFHFALVDIAIGMRNVSSPMRQIILKMSIVNPPILISLHAHAPPQAILHLTGVDILANFLLLLEIELRILLQ